MTIDRLNKADNEPDNWLVYGATYRSLRHSPLDQINVDNVRTLQAVWAFQLGIVDHGLQSTPLIADVGGSIKLAPPPSGKTTSHLGIFSGNPSPSGLKAAGR